MTIQQKKLLLIDIPILTDQVFLEVVSTHSRNFLEINFLDDFSVEPTNDEGHLMGCSCILCQPLKAIRALVYKFMR